MQLQAVKDNWDAKRNDLDAALAFNRKLWTILISSVDREDNPLPKEIRANVLNLGVFILNRTLDVQIEPAPQKLGVLVNINRELAAGLRGSGAPAPKSAA